MERADLLVVGGGVVGLCAAREWRRRRPAARVVVLEKEPEVGAHASGRNSGVLHAGLSYAEDSLKAAFAGAGNREMRAFCEERDLPLRVCGKLVVARDSGELPALDALAERARANGARVELVDAAAVARLEPRARTVERALWSPDTAVVDPGAVMRALAAACRDDGVEVHLGRAFVGRAAGIVTTAAAGASAAPIRADRVLNCAGLHADRVAGAWGAGLGFRLVPFVGRYLVAREPEPVGCCVYPVPDPALPFLGVHVTPTADGATKLGPTAIPARWREDYSGRWFGREGFSGRDAVEQLRAQLGLLIREPVFRRHAVRELPHLSRTLVWLEARRLVTGLRRGRWRTWSRPGIRAQLVDRRTDRLVQDFVVETVDRSVHVLNAVSPAFTAALPFARHLADALEAIA